MQVNFYTIRTEIKQPKVWNYYPKIAKIVEDTANQFGIPYNNKVTFWKAIVSHKRALQDLGTRLHDPLAMAS